MVLALLGVLLSACGSGAPRGERAPVPSLVDDTALAQVVLRVGDQKGGAKSMLAAAGLLDNVPYRIEWSTFVAGPPLLEAASAGAVDIGGVGNTPPLFAAAANAKVSVVSAARGDLTGDAILVPADSPARDLGALRGRTIAVAKGSSAHGVLLSALRNAGLSPSDVTIAYLAPAEAYAAFSQRRVDAWAIWEPYTSQALRETSARVLVDGGSGLTNGLSFQVASRAALADPGRNTAIRDYLIRLAKAMAWADTHREQRAAVWSQETGLPVEVTRAAVERGGDLVVPLDQSVVDSEQRLADAFAEARLLPSRIRFADHVDARHDQDVLAAAK
ncbi:sulfonate transport system substrate-binding protein [Streptoalloteichus tenebrarius]|uniref:Sulfonate transport system substrate-binding protein n=1 Tax=Streptoalloteichus tenebrarius (strain ATCC 17920 / DSM 40477 / JCM 4838 / CBS 697.72 / NBRC 16177 / NCIMB 11028 / NRRL B-12390 / A12253. 1 / ISP 5477) TaxID=1933 RepID=A0ABT1I2Z5_STRSD|nr:sulfonate transport system substrate-binding protein [Streptoalloteichus tenebrarius]BFF02245.1 ABC transporter substrate-binding protein [Streptoalloteichus tenebrarius]